MRDRSGLILFILIILLIWILAQNGMLGTLISNTGIVFGTTAPSLAPVYVTLQPSNPLPAPYAPGQAVPTNPVSIGVSSSGGVSGSVSSSGQCIVPNGWTAYTVQAGDTLAAIATNYNVSAQDLATANCLQNPDMIYEGEVIAVP